MQYLFELEVPHMYRGQRITVNSIVQVVQFSLAEGMKYVLSERGSAKISRKNILDVKEKEVA